MTNQSSDDRGHGKIETGIGPHRQLWLSALRRYIAAIAILNLLWEFMQLPFYTIWWEDTARAIVFAGLHCTAGDIVIATTALTAAILFAGTENWPLERFVPVAVLAVAEGISYTLVSEWVNTQVRGSWTYTEQMPVLPVLGIGLLPVMQWLVLPLLAFWWSQRRI